MKLTQRDKKLLMGLGIFIFLVVFMKFILLPKINDIITLRTDIKKLNDTFTLNMTYKKKTESLDSDIKILSQKLSSLRKIYPPSINGDELLIIMNDIIGKSGLDVTSMGFEKARPLNLQDSATAASEGGKDDGQAAVNENQPQQQTLQGTIPDKISVSSILNNLYLWGMAGGQEAGSQETVIPDGKGFSVLVKIDGQGTNEQIKSFLSSVENLKNVAICKTASITRQDSGQNVDSAEVLKLTAEIEFYGIMDKGAGEYYMLEDGTWMPLPAEGRSNLFKPYDGFTETAVDSIITPSTGSTSGGKDNKGAQKEENYDFSVVASAYGGGLAPSVSISCNNPAKETSYSNPVVYGDSNGMENGEIFIEQKAGKYYCKFKTDHEAYPDRQYSQTFEFIPSGKDLKLVVYSFPRMDVNDKAGLNLNIINNSDKSLIYEIKNDDSKSPRVKIGKTSGKVQNEK